LNGLDAYASTASCQILSSVSLHDYSNIDCFCGLSQKSHAQFCALNDIGAFTYKLLLKKWPERHIFLLWILTLSPLIHLRLYTLLYWSNLPFLIFDILACWRSGLSTIVPSTGCRSTWMSKIKNGG